MTQRITPMLAYEDAAAAIDWLTDAFGFAEREGQRLTDADGTVTHAEIERDGAIVMLATPTPDYQGPRRHREECEAARRWQDNPWVIDGLFVEVDDVGGSRGAPLDVRPAHGVATLELDGRRVPPRSPRADSLP